MLHHPVEDRAGAVAAGSFLIPGYRQDHRAIGRRLADEIDGGGGKGRDAGFHVRRAAPPKDATLDHAAEGIARPGRRIAHRHDIGMAVEAEASRGTFRTPAGEKVGHAAPVRAVTVEPGGRKKTLQQHKRAALGRGDALAADQIGGQGDGIDGFCHAGLLGPVGVSVTGFAARPQSARGLLRARHPFGRGWGRGCGKGLTAATGAI